MNLFILLKGTRNSNISDRDKKMTRLIRKVFT